MWQPRARGDAPSSGSAHPGFQRRAHPWWSRTAHVGCTHSWHPGWQVRVRDPQDSGQKTRNCYRPEARTGSVLLLRYHWAMNHRLPSCREVVVGEDASPVRNGMTPHALVILHSLLFAPREVGWEGSPGCARACAIIGSVCSAVFAGRPARGEAGNCSLTERSSGETTCKHGHCILVQRTVSACHPGTLSLRTLLLLWATARSMRSAGCALYRGECADEPALPTPFALACAMPKRSWRTTHQLCSILVADPRFPHADMSLSGLGCTGLSNSGLPQTPQTSGCLSSFCAAPD